MWLAQWTLYDTREEGRYWAAPPGARCLMDLRSHDQCGEPVLPFGGGLFSTPDDVLLTTGFLLGDSWGGRLSAANKAEWRAMLNLPDPLAASTILDALIETVLWKSDPTNVHRCGCFRSQRLVIRGQALWQRPAGWNVPEMAPIKAARQEDYRRLRAETLRGEHADGTHLKWLGYQVRKYGLRDKQYLDLVPADLQDEGWRPPDTELTESFDKADSDTLGPDQTWAEVNGDLDVIGNQVGPGGTGANFSARVEADLSSDDHSAELEATAGSSGVAYSNPAIRFSASANTYYNGGHRNTSSNKAFIQKTVAGTLTLLFGTNDAKPGYPFLNFLEANDNNLRLVTGGVERINDTDTAITGNVRCGVVFRAEATDERGNNWRAADLAAVAAPRLLGLLGVGT